MCSAVIVVFFFDQNTAYEICIRDWSSDVCSSDLGNVGGALINWGLGAYCLRFKHRRWFPVSDVQLQKAGARFSRWGAIVLLFSWIPVVGDPLTFAAGALRYPLARFLIAVTIGKAARYARGRETERHLAERQFRSEEHTSELQSLMRISYAVFCLKKKQ